MRTAEILARGRDNNFNLIRICAALAVIVSHSFPLSLGGQASQPLEALLTFPLGSLGVKVFFGISGFLILKSFVRRSSFGDFCYARFLRIMPGLLAVSVVTTFIIGPLVTTVPLGAYISDAQTLAYLPKNLSLLWMNQNLPGVFAQNPYPLNVNGSLWTLGAEVECYVGLAAAGLIGLYRKRFFPLFLAAFAVVYIVARYDLIPRYDLVALAELSLPFIVGMTIYQYRTRVPLNLWGVGLGSLLSAITLWIGFAGEEVVSAVIVYAALWAAAIDSNLLRQYNRIGDYSYGVYIYGWPMQQTTAHLWPGVSPTSMIVVAGGAAIICGIASWHLIEKPALDLRTATPPQDRGDPRTTDYPPAEADGVVT